jgi:hypothetical protein
MSWMIGPRYNGAAMTVREALEKIVAEIRGRGGLAPIGNRPPWRKSTVTGPTGIVEPTDGEYLDEDDPWREP